MTLKEQVLEQIMQSKIRLSDCTIEDIEKALGRDKDKIIMALTIKCEVLSERIEFLEEDLDSMHKSYS